MRKRKTWPSDEDLVRRHDAIKTNTIKALADEIGCSVQQLNRKVNAARARLAAKEAQ